MTAKVLAAAIRTQTYDLIVAGVESADGYTGTMPATLAELLGIPQVTFAKSIEGSEGGVKVRRQTADGYHIVECPTPCLLTLTAGANEPRYASFKGIMAAKKKPLETWSLADLDGVDVAVNQEITELTPAEERKAGEKFEDDGTYPNSRLPLALYRQAIESGKASPEAMERLFEHNGWPPEWR